MLTKQNTFVQGSLMPGWDKASQVPKGVYIVHVLETFICIVALAESIPWLWFHGQVDYVILPTYIQRGLPISIVTTYLKSPFHLHLTLQNIIIWLADSSRPNRQCEKEMAIIINTSILSSCVLGEAHERWPNNIQGLVWESGLCRIWGGLQDHPCRHAEAATYFHGGCRVPQRQLFCYFPSWWEAVVHI